MYKENRAWEELNEIVANLLDRVAEATTPPAPATPEMSLEDLLATLEETCGTDNTDNMDNIDKFLQI